MSTEITPLPETGAASTDDQHRPRPAPAQHMCTCGRLRERCVRETVRDVWLESDSC